MITADQVMGADDTHICRVDATHFLLPEVRDAFLMMQRAASANKIDFQICSSFRSFDKQLLIWNRKWRGEISLNTLSGQQLNASTLTDDEKIHAIMLWSALPGASRHHWGTDFDFYDKANIAKQSHKFELITQEYENKGPCAELAQWVHEHAKSFGFYFPYAVYVGGVAREPWHMSFQTIAEQIQSTFDIDVLHVKLQNSDILGKEAILRALPALVERYTYNRGI
jgi:LAS superfamily LD-carboxypeptidase LdcB